MSSYTASALMRDDACPSGVYVHSSSPVAASSATTSLGPSRPPGVTRYMTPLYTSGMISIVPGGSGFVQTLSRSPTLSRSIWSSGLKRCASYVRLYISQSAGSGRSRTPSVTGAAETLASGPACGAEDCAAAVPVASTERQPMRIVSTRFVLMPVVAPILLVLGRDGRRPGASVHRRLYEAAGPRSPGSERSRSDDRPKKGCLTRFFWKFVPDTNFPEKGVRHQFSGNWCLTPIFGQGVVQPPPSARNSATSSSAVRACERASAISASASTRSACSTSRKLTCPASKRASASLAASAA